jgi:hypothetical protein
MMDEIGTMDVIRIIRSLWRLEFFDAILRSHELESCAVPV